MVNPKLQEIRKLRAEIAKLKAGLQEIYKVASISEGVEFYALLAKKTLEGENAL